MAFQTPITIREAIDKINRKDYLLPSIQREYVWSQKQVIELFDSLMKEYPINSFLFWKVNRNVVSEYVFYEFIREFNEFDNNKTKLHNVSGEQEITAVLDGQQRLTSLFIALKGSYASWKKGGKDRKQKKYYPVKKLYLNLLSYINVEEEKVNYQFDFFENKPICKSKFEYWFSLDKMLDLYDVNKIITFIDNNLEGYLDNHKIIARSNLIQLHKVIFILPLVNYFLETDQSLDKVLNIFIRVNNGGSQLTPATLLFSFANSHWTDINFKDEVNKLVDELNSIGSKFSVNHEFIMKSLLYLSDVTDLSAKIDNFTKTNMDKFKLNWDKIVSALRITFDLVASLGFNYKNVKSNMIYHPIAYYIFKNNPKNISTDPNNHDLRVSIRKWISTATLGNIFSYAPDGALIPIRKIIKNSITLLFPLEDIRENFIGTNRTLVFTEDAINKILEYKKDNKNVFAALSLLYPNLDYRNIFHIDHIYPISKMNRLNIEAVGLNGDEWYKYKMKCDSISNLQLLEGVINQIKGNQDVDSYLSSINDLTSYKVTNFLPVVPDYTLLNFDRFYELRKQKLKDLFTSILT